MTYVAMISCVKYKLLGMFLQSWEMPETNFFGLHFNSYSYPILTFV